MSPEHNMMASAFIIFWILTQAECTKSLTAYLYRTTVVVLYSVLISWPGHDGIYSTTEWCADGLVMMHFFQFVSIFRPE